MFRKSGVPSSNPSAKGFRRCIWFWTDANSTVPPVGIRGRIDSDLPAGAGLASSAALEVTVAVALCRAAGFDAEHAPSSARERTKRGASHHAETNDDDVVPCHAPPYCLLTNANIANPARLR